jgi:hypothetical protein
MPCAWRQAQGIARDGGRAPGLATPLALTPQAQGLMTAGMPPVQEIGVVGIEDPVATGTASPALGQGGCAQRANPRLLADAERGRHGRPRPSLVVQGPHLLVERHPSGPALGRLLLSSWRRGWDGDGRGAVSQRHPLTTDGIIDGRERLVMHLEHLFEGFHQLLQQVKPVSDLSGLWRSLARPNGIGFGPIASDDLHPWMRLEPLRQGLGLPIGS